MRDFILQYWIEFLFGLIVAVLGVVLKLINKKVKLTLNKLGALSDGVLSLSRAEIIRIYEKSKDRGYCPIYAKDATEKAYKAYHNLGGNGTITQLYEELMSMSAEPNNK